LIGIFDEVQEPMWKLIGVPVCSFFPIFSAIPLILLRAGYIVVYTSYHQYPTKIAQRIYSFSICQ
jgi:hypothetical protein